MMMMKVRKKRKKTARVFFIFFVRFSATSFLFENASPLFKMASLEEVKPLTAPPPSWKPREASVSDSDDESNSSSSSSDEEG